MNELPAELTLAVRDQVDHYLEQTVMRRYRPLAIGATVLSGLLSIGIVLGAWLGFKSWIQDVAKTEAEGPAQRTAETVAGKIRNDLEDRANKSEERLSLAVEKTVFASVRRDAAQEARGAAKLATVGLKAEELALDSTFTAALIGSPVFDAAIRNRTQDFAFPVGTIVAYGLPLASPKDAPGGWLLCDGRWITAEQVQGEDIDSSKPYQKLFDRLKSTWGAEFAGARQPKLPDLRGMFLRGANGNLRNDSFKDASGASQRYLIDGTTPTNSYDVGTWQQASINASTRKGVDLIFNPGGETAGNIMLQHLDHSVAEVRPKNAAVHWIIKY